MKTIEELLKNLARPEVMEFGLVTNRLPSVNIGGKFEPVDDEAPSTERLMQMLVTMGGDRHLDALSDKPVQWTTRLDGVGVIAVAAIMRKDIVQARFTVAKRERAAGQGPTGTLQHSSTLLVGPGLVPGRGAQPASSARAPQGAAQWPPRATGAEVSLGAKQAVQSSLQTVRSVGPTGANAATPLGPRPSVFPQSSSALTTKASASPASQTAPSSSYDLTAKASASPASQTAPTPSSQPLSPRDDEGFDDDDEPTLQTLSPPVSRPPVSPPPAPDHPRPKPPRRPEDVSGSTPARPGPRAPERGVGAQGAEERQGRAHVAKEAAAQGRAPQEAADEQAVQAEPRAVAEEVAAEPRRAGEQRAARARAVAEEVAAEPRRAGEQRAVQERATQERATQELARIREQRAAKGRLWPEDVVPDGPPARASSAPGVRRIATPTSVDAVEVATSAAAEARRPAALDLDLDADGSEGTLSAPRSHGAPQGGPTSTEPVGLARVPAAPPDALDVDALADGGWEALLTMAVAAGASDLHVIAGRPALLRVAGELIPRSLALSAELVERMARELLPASRREVFDASGACDFAIEHPTQGRFRVNASRQRTGTKLTLRPIPKEPLTLAELGLPEAMTEALREECGLVLVVGPRGQGKSTTLAALVDHLHRERSRRIVTIEDPIEHVHPRRLGLVTQREIGDHARSSSRAIEATFQEDADVLVIGEIRDAETMRLAVAAAESGRLVLGTMTAPRAAKAIGRIVELLSPADASWVGSSLVASLRLVVGQHLVPSADRASLYAAVELLPSSEIRGLLRHGRAPTVSNRDESADPPGLVRLEDSLTELVRAQRVTLEAARQLAGSAFEPGPPGARPARAQVRS